MFVDARKNFWIEEATLSPSAQIPPHTHRDCWELNFTKRGCGVRTLGRSTEPFARGDVVLTPPRVTHFWDFRPWKKKFCTYCVFIRERWIDELQATIPSLKDDLAPLLRTTVSVTTAFAERTPTRRPPRRAGVYQRPTSDLPLFANSGSLFDDANKDDQNVTTAPMQTWAHLPLTASRR